MDAIRAQLDALMGPDRDGEVKAKNYWEPTVCKQFLLDFCLGDLFRNTKNDLGPCKDYHSHYLRAQFEQLVQKGDEKALKDKRYYESVLMRDMERLLRDCDRVIESQKKKLEGIKEETAAKEPEEVKKINEDIARLQAQVEKLGESGDLDGCRHAVAAIQELEKQKEEIISKAASASSLSASSLPQAAIPTQKSRAMQNQYVCETCGAMLSKLDNETRIADHHAGKQHAGFTKLRAKMTELQEQGITPAGSSRRGDDRPSEGHFSRGSRDRSRESRDYRRRHSRSRSRSRRSRDRNGRRSRSPRDRRDRRRSRSRSYDRRDRRDRRY